MCQMSGDMIYTSRWCTLSTSVVLLCKVLLLIVKSGDELISIGKAVVIPCGSALVFVEML